MEELKRNEGRFLWDGGSTWYDGLSYNLFREWWSERAAIYLPELGFKWLIFAFLMVALGETSC